MINLKNLGSIGNNVQAAITNVVCDPNAMAFVVKAIAVTAATLQLLQALQTYQNACLAAKQGQPVK